ncbi:MAG: DUF190 domain-containing protein [Acidobacteria bacterium]|nr:DUF190 domain-containing protein [Acidobacteriota bacterium]
MFENILVAIDASVGARQALEFGIRLARQHNAQLRVITVVPLPEYGGTVGEIEDAEEKGRVQGETLMREARQLAESLGQPITTEILFGHPADTICTYAGRHGFDLIVVGKQSGVRPIADRFRLGGVADEVVRYAPCPVFIVGEKEVVKYTDKEKPALWELRKEHRETLHGRAKMLRIYIGEQDRFEGRPLYEAIVLKLRELDIAGATVYRGIMGYGAAQRIHKGGVLSLSHDLPILIVAIDAEEHIRRALPVLDEMLEEGLIVLSTVEVIKYTYVAEPSASGAI